MLARNFLVIAPNFIVLNRLRADFDGLKTFFNDPLLPDNGFEGRNWHDDFQITLHNRASSTMEVIEELIKLAKEMDAAAKRGQDLGLTDDEVAFYDALAVNESAVKAMGDDKLKLIAAKLISQVRKSVTIDWTLREGARAKIRVRVKRIPNKYGTPARLTGGSREDGAGPGGAAVCGAGAGQYANHACK